MPYTTADNPNITVHDSQQFNT